MIIKICIGSSCHLKGSYDVIAQLKELVKKYGVEDRVELQAAFCLNRCADGVSGKIESVSETEDGLFLHHLSASNMEQIFVERILPGLQ